MSAERSLKVACELLGVPCHERGGLRDSLCQTPNTMFTKSVGVKGAAAQRDALAKMMYSRLFDWIIGRLNHRLMQFRGSQNKRIGMLDIFGFEDMPVNSLEQLYINLANERIQNLFNATMFECDLDIYRSEGLAIVTDIGPSNLPCLELFLDGCSESGLLPTPHAKHPPPGLVRLLADACKVGGRDDQDISFLSNLTKSMQGRTHYQELASPSMTAVNAARRKRWRSLAIDLDPRECFGIRHYAGEVVYAVRGFVSKSKDVLPDHLSQVLSKSKRPGIAEMMSVPADRKSASLTIGEKFVKQLGSLAGKLNEGKNLFVRCIKPNSEACPGVVDRSLVVEQLTSGGVVAALDIRRHGYPERLDYVSFCEQFGVLDAWRRQREHPQSYCEDLLVRFLGGEATAADAAFGRSKVFLRYGLLARLRALVTQKENRSAVRVQRKWRELQGMSILHKVGDLARRLDESKANAARQGVDNAPAVVELLRRIEDTMERIWDTFEQARARFQNYPVQSYNHRVGDALLKNHERHIRECDRWLREVDEQILKTAEVKARADRGLDDRLQDLRVAAMDLVTEVREYEDELSDIALHEGHRPAHDYASCEQACSSAHSRLDQFLRRDLKDAQQQGPSKAYLADDSQDPCPGAYDLLVQAQGCVREVEDLLRKCRSQLASFDGQVGDWQRKRVEARKRAEEIQEEAVRLGVLGITPEGEIQPVSPKATILKESLGALWSHERHAEELAEREEDPRGFCQVVSSMLQEVGASEKALEELSQLVAGGGPQALRSPRGVAPPRDPRSRSPLPAERPHNPPLQRHPEQRVQREQREQHARSPYSDQRSNTEQRTRSPYSDQRPNSEQHARSPYSDQRSNLRVPSPRSMARDVDVRARTEAPPSPRGQKHSRDPQAWKEAQAALLSPEVRGAGAAFLAAVRRSLQHNGLPEDPDRLQSTYPASRDGRGPPPLGSPDMLDLAMQLRSLSDGILSVGITLEDAASGPPNRDERQSMPPPAPFQNSSPYVPVRPPSPHEPRGAGRFCCMVGRRPEPPQPTPVPASQYDGSGLHPGARQPDFMSQNNYRSNMSGAR